MRIAFEPNERSGLLARLSLPDDASDQQIATAFDAWATEQPTPAAAPVPTPAPEPVPTPEAVTPPQPDVDTDTDDDDDVPDSDDVIVLDVAAYRGLTARALQAAAIEEEARVNRRDSLIAGAIRDGRFGPGRRQHYEARFDSDPEDTERLISRMQAGVVPLTERGRDATDEEVESDAYDTTWLPELAAKQQERGNGNGERRATRVISEE